MNHPPSIRTKAAKGGKIHTNTAPASAKGVTRKLIQGIANALARGLTNDSCEKNNTDQGTIPSVTAICIREALLKAR